MLSDTLYLYTNFSLLNVGFTFYFCLSYWIQSKGLEAFFVHGVPRRTKYNIELFYSQLEQKLQTVYPNLWTLLGD